MLNPFLDGLGFLKSIPRNTTKKYLRTSKQIGKYLFQQKKKKKEKDSAQKLRAFGTVKDGPLQNLEISNCPHSSKLNQTEPTLSNLKKLNTKTQ